MLYVNPIRLVREFAVVSGGWWNKRSLIAGIDRTFGFIFKLGVTILIVVGMIIGVLALWAAIIFVSIWSLFFMVSYL